VTYDGFLKVIHLPPEACETKHYDALKASMEFAAHGKFIMFSIK